MAATSIKSVYDILYRHYGTQSWWPAETPFEVIVGAILTQNTAWVNVERAITNLKGAGAMASPRALRKLGTRGIARLIRPAGYYNVKAKRLMSLLDHLEKRYGSDLRRVSRIDTASLRQDLLEVNGVGPETCDSILLYAFGKAVFVVDAYTRRIFARHGLVSEDAGYDEIQRIFTDGLPGGVEVYNEYHALIVRLAKDFCRKSPKCEGCPMSGVRMASKSVAKRIAR